MENASKVLATAKTVSVILTIVGIVLGLFGIYQVTKPSYKVYKENYQKVVEEFDDSQPAGSSSSVTAADQEKAENAYAEAQEWQNKISLCQVTSLLLILGGVICLTIAFGVRKSKKAVAAARELGKL